MGRKSIKSRPGLFGYTNYYDEKGRCVGKSRPGAFGTTVYFDEKGRLVGKSHKGFLVKEVYHDVDHKRYITTYDGIIGESHYENGVPIGHTRPGFFGSEYTTLETEDEIQEEEYLAEDFQEDQEDFDDCEYEDLETEAEDYEEYTPYPSQHTIVRNLQLFVLCLVICAVIACIYAIVRFN